MPHFAIKMLEGKTQEQKQELTQEIIKAAQRVIGHGNESYSVTIEDFTWDEWKQNVYPNDIMSRQDIIFKKPGYKV